MYNLEDYIQCSLSISCLRKLSELLKTQLSCFWFLLCLHPQLHLFLWFCPAHVLGSLTPFTGKWWRPEHANILRHETTVSSEILKSRFCRVTGTWVLEQLMVNRCLTLSKWMLAGSESSKKNLSFSNYSVCISFINLDVHSVCTLLRTLVNNPFLLCKGKEFQEKGDWKGKLAVL